MDEPYEYRVVTASILGRQQQEFLDQYSREGWQLVNSTPMTFLGLTTAMRLTFRRHAPPGQMPPPPVLKMPSEPQASVWWLVSIVTIIGIGLLTAMMIF
jgi:Domain of unknown function (DUF4177)